MPLTSKLIRMAKNAQSQYKDLNWQANNTAISSSVGIEIKVDDPKTLYHSGDVITGEVILAVHKEIDLLEITLKYKVDESTQLLRPEVGQKGKGSHELVSYRGSSRIYEKGIRLFPSQKEFDALQMRKLTLPVGTHCYPFSVRIPGHEKDNYKFLPPSFSDDDSQGAHVYHTLKATLKRSSSFKQNSRYEFPVNFTPRATPHESSGQFQTLKNDVQLSSGSFFNKTAKVIRAYIDMPYGLQSNTNTPIRVKLASADKSRILPIDITVELFSQLTIKAQGQTEVKQGRTVLTHLRGNPVSLDSIALKVPKHTVPSFETDLIILRYKLTFSIQVDMGNNKQKAIVFSQPINVFGPPPQQQQFDTGAGLYSTETYPPVSASSSGYAGSSKLNSGQSLSSPSAEKPVSVGPGQSDNYSPSKENHGPPPTLAPEQYYPREKGDPNDQPPAYY